MMAKLNRHRRSNMRYVEIINVHARSALPSATTQPRIIIVSDPYHVPGIIRLRARHG